MTHTLYSNESTTIEGDAWHELRATTIGGSEIAGLFDLQQPYQLSRYGLWAVKSKLARDEFDGNERTTWGQRLEAAIAQGAAEDNGWTIRKGGYFTDPTTRGLGATLDYIILTSPEHTTPGALEVKNVDGLVFRDKWVDGEPPEHILLQLQHQLAASGFAWGVIVALVNGNEMHTYEYAAREGIISQIRERVTEFWSLVDSGTPPEIDGEDTTTAILKAMSEPVRYETEDMSADAEFAEICAGYLRTKAAEKNAAEEHAVYKNLLFEKAGSFKKAEGGGFRVTQVIKSDTPDRVAKPGEIISGRKGGRHFLVKEV